MLDVVALVKRFGRRAAVDGVSFRVDRGEAVGLLGPNGAGKTTTVSLIAGLLRPDAGEVRFDGRPIAGDADPHKRRLGLVPQELALVEELSGRANLRFFGALQGLGGRALAKAVDRCLELVSLEGRAGDPVRAYSGGMKRRLNLAAALLHEPTLILLDEPTVGVDPQSRNSLFDCFDRLKAEGRSILYTTHYMEEAERLCDRIVIVDRGRVVADDDIAGLRARVGGGAARLAIDFDGPAASRWPGGDLGGVVAVAFEGDRATVDLDDPADAPAVLAVLAERGARPSGFSSRRVDLEAIFLALTGRSLRDG